MRARVVFAISIVAGAGCLFPDSASDPQPEPDDRRPTSDPPRFVRVSVPDFPPVGPTASVTVDVSDDVGLSRLEYAFAEWGSVPVAGTSRTVVLSGSQLGEGFGRLTLTVYDTHGGGARTVVESLLVDLSAPRIDLGWTLVRPGGSLEAVVADAWLLGSVELRIGDTTVEEDFPDVYPSTFGEIWDYALVRFPLEGIEEGRHPAVLTLRDAAGNSATERFEVVVDGTQPQVTISSPAPDSIVSGRFAVEVCAEDDGGGAVLVTLRLGGVDAAIVGGPCASVTLDASDFAAGPTTLEALAYDEAGNVGEAVPVPLVIGS